MLDRYDGDGGVCGSTIVVGDFALSIVESVELMDDDDGCGCGIIVASLILGRVGLLYDDNEDGCGSTVAALSIF